MSENVSTQSFPWQSLATLTRLEVAALRDARIWAEQYVRLDAFSDALQALIGQDVQIRLRRIEPRATARPPTARIGVALTRAERDIPFPEAVLDVDPALAAAAVARVVRRSPPPVVDERQAPAAVAGAFAAVLLVAARRAYGAEIIRILDAGEATTLAEIEGDASEVLALTLTVILADSAFDARLRIARRILPPSNEGPWTTRILSRLGEAPLSIPVVACVATMTAADVAHLQAGDVWLPGSWALSVSSSTERTLTGKVHLAAPLSDTGVCAQLVDGMRLVLSGHAEALSMEESKTVESDGRDAVLHAVGDVPVVVRVEVGEARMTARQWASVARGDVIPLGCRLGAHVLIRIGGVPVARGELVNVEGEVGVRISDRIVGEPAGT